MAHRFLRDDGWFRFPTPGDISFLSTSSSTAFLGTVTKSATANIALSAGVATTVATVAQGSSGTWWATASALIIGNGASVNNVYAELWDGTSVIASGGCAIPVVGVLGTFTLAGAIVSPAGNIRLTLVSSAVATTAAFNQSGFSNDTNITVLRIG